MKKQSGLWAISFDHAAVATREPEKLKNVLLLLGIEDSGNEDVLSQGVKTHFLKVKGDPKLGVDPCVEILEVLDPNGVVAKFLDKKGPGIHHLSFRVSAIKVVCDYLKNNKVRLVYDTPRPGAHNTRVNFIHPESTGGILIEITDKAP